VKLVGVRTMTPLCSSIAKLDDNIEIQDIILVIRELTRLKSELLVQTDGVYPHGSGGFGEAKFALLENPPPFSEFEKYIWRDINTDPVRGELSKKILSSTITNGNLDDLLPEISRLDRKGKVEKILESAKATYEIFSLCGEVSKFDYLLDFERFLELVEEKVKRSTVIMLPRGFTSLVIPTLDSAFCYPPLSGELEIEYWWLGSKNLSVSSSDEKLRQEINSLAQRTQGEALELRPVRSMENRELSAALQQLGREEERKCDIFFPITIEGITSEFQVGRHQSCLDTLLDGLRKVANVQKNDYGRYILSQSHRSYRFSLGVRLSNSEFQRLALRLRILATVEEGNMSICLLELGDEETQETTSYVWLAQRKESRKLSFHRV